MNTPHIKTVARFSEYPERMKKKKERSILASFGSA
jgi:hypothetical protein